MIGKYFKIKAFVLWLVILAGLIYCMVSCSAPKLLQRAIKKDPNVLSELVSNDTVKIETTVYSDSGIYKDSALIDNDRVYIKALVEKGYIALSYRVKPVLIDTILPSKKITVSPNVFKTRQDKRLQARQDRLETIQKSKVEQVAIKSNAPLPERSLKQVFHRLINLVSAFIFGVIVGVILVVCVLFFRKR